MSDDNQMVGLKVTVMGRPMAFEQASVAAFGNGRYEISAIGLLAETESGLPDEHEIERLRALITAWADADDAARRAGRYSDDAVVYESVRKELRKAVGR